MTPLRPRNREPAAVRNFKVLLRLAAGWFLLLLGIVGLFVPVLQGLLFIVLGSMLLAPHIPLFEKIKQHLHHRFPATTHLGERFKKRFHRKPPA